MQIRITWTVPQGLVGFTSCRIKRLSLLLIHFLMKGRGVGGPNKIIDNAKSYSFSSGKSNIVFSAYQINHEKPTCMSAKSHELYIIGKGGPLHNIQS